MCHNKAAVLLDTGFKDIRYVRFKKSLPVTCFLNDFVKLPIPCFMKTDFRKIIICVTLHTESEIMLMYNNGSSFFVLIT